MASSSSSDMMVSGGATAAEVEAMVVVVRERRARDEEERRAREKYESEEAVRGLDLPRSTAEAAVVESSGQDGSRAINRRLAGT